MVTQNGVDLIRRGDYGNAEGHCIHTSCLKLLLVGYQTCPSQSYNRGPTIKIHISCLRTETSRQDKLTLCTPWHKSCKGTQGMQSRSAGVKDHWDH